MNTKKMTFTAMGIVINIVFGTLVSFLKIPLIFLDTIGTIFTAVVLGPVYGMMAGGLTNIIQGMLTNPKNIPFALVNIGVGLIVGLIAKKRGFNLKTAIITGCVLAVVAPLIGTPIAVWIYGGITGDGNDFIFMWLQKSGQSMFTSAFIPRITGNILDKIVSCALVSILIARIPSNITKVQNNEAA